MTERGGETATVPRRGESVGTKLLRVAEKAVAFLVKGLVRSRVRK